MDSDGFNNVVRFIVNGIEPKFVLEFMEGFRERVAACAEAPTDDRVAAVDQWLGEWVMAARLLHDRSFLTAASATDTDEPVTGAELRRRVIEKRSAVHA
jgi:hypothetical protein